MEQYALPTCCPRWHDRVTGSKRTLADKLRRARKQHVEAIHEWRPRRSRYGELVQWDTSEHDWLEGRGEKMQLINMIDAAVREGIGKARRTACR